MAKTLFRRSCQCTKRDRPRPPPAESGGASKVRHVHETTRREVGLSSRCFQDGSKPGLKQTFRLLACSLRVILHVFMYMLILYIRFIVFFGTISDTKGEQHLYFTRRTTLKRLNSSIPPVPPPALLAPFVHLSPLVPSSPFPFPPPLPPLPSPSPCSRSGCSCVSFRLPFLAHDMCRACW